MKLNELNEELLNELSLQDVKNFGNKVIANSLIAKEIAKLDMEWIKRSIKTKFKKTSDLFKGEIQDNKEAQAIIVNQVKNLLKGNREMSPEQLAIIINQMKDNIRMLFFLGIGIAPLGSVAALPLIAIAKKLNISLKIENNNPKLPTL